MSLWWINTRTCHTVACDFKFWDDDYRNVTERTRGTDFGLLVRSFAGHYLSPGSLVNGRRCRPFYMCGGQPTFIVAPPLPPYVHPPCLSRQILALNCLISAYSLSVLYLDGVKYGDRQMTALGMLMSVSFITISRSKPLSKLSPVRPITSIFHPALFLSILGQVWKPFPSYRIVSYLLF